MTDQAEGQSPSIKEQIGALLAPPKEQEPEPPPELQQQEVPQTAETPQEVAETDPTADWKEVELDGERIAVPPKFEKAFLQERDYTQKTQSIADERRLIEQRAQALALQEQTLSQLQPLYANAIRVEQQIQDMQKLDWQTLQTTDPLQYATRRADYAALLQQRNEVQGQFQRAQAYFGQQRQAMIAQAAAQAAPVLKRAIPDWGPEKDAALTKYALSNGATPNELLGLAAKPWNVVMLEKARKYDELQAGKAQLPKKVVGLSPVAKPGARPTQTGQQASFRNAIEQLQKSGGKDGSAIRAAIKAKLVK